MRRTTRLLAALALTTSGMAAPALAQTMTPPSERNAAVKYWATWAMISREMSEKTGEVNYDQMGGPQEYTKITDAFKAADEVVFDEIVEGIIEAGRMTKCDFQTEFEQGPFAMMNHLSKARQSARILRVDARSKLIAGDISAAGERIAALFRMADDIGREPVLIGSLVGAAIGSYANSEADFLAKTGKMTPAARDIILEAVREMDDADPYHFIGAVKGEQFWLAEWMRKEFDKPNAGTELAKFCGTLGNETADEKVIAAEIAGMDVGALRADLDRMDEYYAQAIAFWDKENAVQKLSDLSELAENGAYGTLAKVFSPALSKARQSAEKALNELSAASKAVEASVPESKDGQDQGK